MVGVEGCAFVVAAPLLKSLLQVLNGFGIHAVIFLGVTEVEGCFDLREFGVGTDRVASFEESATVEGGNGGDAVWEGGGRAKRQRTREAVSEDGDGAWRYAVLIKSGDIGSGVGVNGIGSQRLDEFSERCRVRGSAKFIGKLNTGGALTR